MANTETQILDEMIVASRRRMLRMGGTAFAGLVMGGATARAQSSTLTDTDYLNFALNLEYLEAEYYTLAITGTSIKNKGVGVGPGTSASGGGTLTLKPGGPAACKVPFGEQAIYDYGYEIAVDEQRHVLFLRNALGSAAVAEPDLDLYNSFNAAAAAAGLGPVFDPFANDVSFLLGSYIFEDVGVTAYHGAVGALTASSNVAAASSILAVEAYHAGLIRTLLWGFNQAYPLAGIAASKISALRATLDGTGNDDLGLGTQQVALNTSTANFTASTIVNADSNTIAFSRTPQEVLDIVYASASGTKGGFFPSGLNGNIS